MSRERLKRRRWLRCSRWRNGCLLREREGYVGLLVSVGKAKLLALLRNLLLMLLRKLWLLLLRIDKLLLRWRLLLTVLLLIVEHMLLLKLLLRLLN